MNESDEIVLNLEDSVCTRRFTHEVMRDEQGQLVDVCIGFWIDEQGKRHDVSTVTPLE